MGGVHVSEHLQEMEEFLRQSDKLKTILNNMSNLDKVDRNDLYELVYSKKSIEKWLEGNIENKDIEASLRELLESINLVLKSLTDDTLKKIVDRKIHDGKKVEKLNKIKYDNKKQYKSLIDKGSLIEDRRNNIIKLYILQRLSLFVILLVFSMLITSGKLLDVAQYTSAKALDLTKKVNESTSSTEVGIEESTDNIANLGSDTDEHAREAMNNFGQNNRTIEQFEGAFATIISIAMTMVFFMASISVCIDLLYITIPAFRMLFSKYISSDIKKLVELAKYEPVTHVHEVIDYRDKFKVATALLNNIIDYLEELRRFNLAYNTNKKSYKEIENEITLITGKIKSIKSQTKSDNILLKVEALVDAEMIYIDNKDAIDENEDIFKNYKYKNVSQHILKI